MGIQQTVLVTGAGRGVGRATVERFAAEGWRAVAAVRDVEAARAAFAGVPGVEIVAMDVTDAGAVAAGVARAQEVAGGALDCVVSNAGYAVMGAVEDADLDEVRAMFETNFVGAARVLQAAVPAMREARRGSVVVVSSVGARMSNPLVGMYHASKYALLAITESLSFELRPFGIHVASVEPGMIDTDFPSATRRTGALADGRGPYLPLGGQLREGFARWRAEHPTGPRDVADAVYGAATTPGGPFRVPVGADTDRLVELRALAGDDQREWERRQAGFLGLDWT